MGKAPRCREKAVLKHLLGPMEPLSAILYPLRRRVSRPPGAALHFRRALVSPTKVLVQKCLLNFLSAPYYRSLGINVKQLYKMTAASVFVCVQPDGEVRADTVGTPMPEVEVQISPEGRGCFAAQASFWAITRIHRPRWRRSPRLGAFWRCCLYWTRMVISKSSTVLGAPLAERGTEAIYRLVHAL